MEEIKITSVLTTIALILIGVLLFELIIFIHEFGHFITAKKSGIKVNEFSLGMGPKIFSFGKGETKYSLRIFPIGGFCAMEGEDEESPEPRAFNNAKVWKRMIVVIAGAVMNIILGFVLMFVVVVQQDSYSSTEVQSFPATSFSSCTGLQSGDVIKEINGYGISTSMDFNYPISTAELKTVDGSTLEIYKEDCGNNLYNMAVSLVQDKNNKLSDEQVSKVNELLSKSTNEIVKAKSKEDAFSVYENYYKEINNACGIKNYKVEKIVEKETRKRYTADILVERNGEEVDYDDNEEVEEEAPTNRYKDEETSDLRKKVLEHFIETQKGVIEKHKDDTSEEGQEKLKKAQQKLAEFEKQLEALND